MFLKNVSFVLLFTAFLSIAGAADSPQLYRVPEKKLIFFGWDNPTPEYLAKNLEKLEKTLPYDGMGISILNKIVPHPVTKKKISLSYQAFTGLPFDEKWFEQDRKYLKSMRNAKKFKHNFLNANMCNFNGDFDLFSDTFWNSVNKKFACFAKMAKEGNLAGIHFDMEDYGNYNKWAYRRSCGRSFDEAYLMARKRGKDFIKAMTDEYPQLTLFCLFWLDLTAGPATNGMPMLYERLEGAPTGLLVGFINGIYDGLPPTAKIVDGMEADSYAARKLDDYYRLSATRDLYFKLLVAPENQRKLREQTSLSIGFYLDSYLRKDKKGVTYAEKLAKEANLSLLSYFRRNFTYTAKFSHEYVWTWSEALRWIPGKHNQSYKQKAAENMMRSGVKGPLWTDGLPGISEAMLYAKNPYNYIIQKVKEGKVSGNLLKNGSFDQGKVKEKHNVQTPDAVIVPALTFWECWQQKRSKGKFAAAPGKGWKGSVCLQITGVTSGCTHQGIKIKPSSVYYVTALIKNEGKSNASLGIQWRNHQGKWHAHFRNLALVPLEDAGNGWKKAIAVIDYIPPETSYMNVMLNVGNSGKEEKVYFDEVEIREVYVDDHEEKKDKVSFSGQKKK